MIARPLAALIVAYGFTLPERLMLGWAGLRGATPIVFATFPVTEGIPHGHTIFQVAFFVVLLSTVLQGLTIEPVARWLGVTVRRGGDPGAAGRAGAAEPAGRGDDAVPGRARATPIDGHPVRELGLPREALLNVIVRGERAIPPRGSTIIQDGDQLHVLVRQEVAVEFRELMRRWRTGPVGPPERPRRPPAQPPVGHLDPPVAAGRRRPAAPEGARRPRPSSSSCARAATSRARWSLLEDGRFGVCGPLLAVGPSGELQAFARRRLSTASSAGRARLVAGGRRAPSLELSSRTLSPLT